MSMAKRFPNFMQIKPTLPLWFWHLCGAISVLCVIILCVLLFVAPQSGLFVFWFVFVPIAPLIFFIAPGFWRNICPMATVNQLSREGRISLSLRLPSWLAEYSYVISTVLIFLIVPARKHLFDYEGPALAVLLITCMVAAFLGGFVFKGKSGWCSSFCPLLPIQRVYGQVPFIAVRNSHCRPCVGCVENCYDFNPAIAGIAALNDPNKYKSGYRKLFISSLPGLIVAYFVVPNAPALSILQIYLQCFAIIAISIAIFNILTLFVKVRESIISLFYGAAAFNLYYWLTSPLLQKAYDQAFHLSIKNWQIDLFLSVLFFLTLLWLWRGVRREQSFFAEMAQENMQKITNLTPIKHFIKKQSSNPVITVLPKGKKFLASPGDNLLKLCEEESLPIEAGCRMGMCGADPVTIHKGIEHLNPPSEDERNTLQRLGLSPRCRMACSTHVQGNIVISLDPEYLSKPSTATSEHAPSFQKIKDIVIIGNGVAGMTTAQNIKVLNPEANITVISQEPYFYYNRIAITRLIYARSSIDHLSLLPKNWQEKPYADCLLNTLVTHIEPKEKIVVLSDNKKISYDKLVLATGGSPYIPPIKKVDLPGCFSLRNAEDAFKIRSYVQKSEAHHAVIAGAGLLGIETAYALHKLNLHVTLIETHSHLLHKQLDEKAAAYLLRYLAGLNIDIVLNAHVTEIEGTHSVEFVHLSSGNKLPTHLFILCCGIQPNISLAVSANLNVHHGIVVDQKMQTSDPDIYAVGDVAEVNGNIEGLWVSSMRQAKTASYNLLGLLTAAYTGSPSNTLLKIAGIDVVSIGDVQSSSAEDQVLIQENAQDHRYIKLILSRDKIRGYMAINEARYSDVVNHAIQSNMVIPTAILSELQNGSFDALLSLRV